MADPNKRIDIESSRQTQKADPVGRIREYVKIVWTIYGQGPYELFILREGATVETIRNDFLVLPGKLTCRAGRNVLQLPRDYHHRKIFLEAAAKIEKLRLFELSETKIDRFRNQRGRQISNFTRLS